MNPDMHTDPDRIDIAANKPRGRRRLAVAGAILGVAALGLAATSAGAVDSTSSTPSAAGSSAAVLATDDGLFEGTDQNPLVVDAEWKAFDDCITQQVGDLFTQLDQLESAEPESIDEDAFDAIFTEENEQRFADAETACEQLLPQEIRDEIAAFTPFDECFEAALAGVEDPIEDVADEALADAQFAELDAAFEAADQECSPLLPEGFDFFDDFAGCDDIHDDSDLDMIDDEDTGVDAPEPADS